ncbi:cytochrome c family protein [Nitratireductor sp. B36]|uniref:c-type cytochrome n=1 Tax=Nitratireductor sp. B36 TaxID=2762059 RepID=UPI001E534690|nr:cytochrome c family protein [Nitratireductor sp. B36]MCC5781108.1 cytochrome c family protein [Nitratireductor sp. B36]
MKLARVRLSVVAFSLVAAAPALADVQAKLAEADITKGEKLFKRCVACHTVEKDGKNKVGPNLYGIVGKPVAHVEDYSYSPAMKAYGGEWTVERLDAYLLQPRAEVKGTKMAFAGLKKEEDRVNLIAYLSTFSDAPVQSGAAAEEAAPAEQTASAAPTEGEDQTIEGDFGRLKVAPGVDTTFYACTACHSEMIIAQQGLTRDGWDEMLDWMVDEQGMDDIPEPDRTEILDYLSTHYNEDRPNFPNPN